MVGLFDDLTSDSGGLFDDLTADAPAPSVPNAIPSDNSAPPQGVNDNVSRQTIPDPLLTAVGKGAAEGADVDQPVGDFPETKAFLQKIGVMPTPKNLNAFNAVTGYMADLGMDAVDVGGRAFEAVVHGGAAGATNLLQGFGVAPDQAKQIGDTLGQMVEYEGIKGGEHDAGELGPRKTAATLENQAPPLETDSAGAAPAAPVSAPAAAPPRLFDDIPDEGSALPSGPDDDMPQITSLFPSDGGQNIITPEETGTNPAKIAQETDAPSLEAEADAATKPDLVQQNMDEALATGEKEQGPNGGADVGPAKVGYAPATGATIQTPTKPPRSPRAKQPVDLVQFLAANGGLQAVQDAAGRGDLQAIDAHRVFVPGSGMLVRSKGGKSLDYAREAATEAGYGPFETPADLVNAIDENIRGNRQYSRMDTFDQAARGAQVDTRTDMTDEEKQMEGLKGRARQLGIESAPSWTAEDLDAAITEREAMMAEPRDLGDLADAREGEVGEELDRMRGLYDPLDSWAEENDVPRTAALPAKPDVPPAASTHGEGREGPAAGGKAQAPGPGAQAEGRGENAVPGAPEDLIDTEDGVIPQKVIAGAERASPRAMMERQAQGKKGASANQKATTGFGLFDPEAAMKAPEEQPDIFSQPTPAGKAVDDAAKVADQNPTPAQIEAGNYQKGHVKIHGMDVSIETPKGATRRGIGANGKPWESVNDLGHYGYIKGTVGADGEHMDTYVGPNPESARAFVVDQVDPKTRAFDEHKAVLGVDNLDQALKVYDAGFSDGSGPKRRAHVTEMTVDQFKDYLKNTDLKKPTKETIPAAEDEPKFQRAEPTFYSALERGVGAAKQDRAPGVQWAQMIDNLPGVKKEEVDWSGVKDWLKEQKGPVTKADLLAHIRENNVQVKEVEKGAAKTSDEFTRAIYPELGPDARYEDLPPHAQQEVDAAVSGRSNRGATKFGEYTLPGGENYRELLLTLPEGTKESRRIGNQAADYAKHLREKYGERYATAASPQERARFDELIHQSERAESGAQFKSSHFDEPNVVAHVRFDDRTGPNGEKILHMAEVQSDWHQKGRRGGYRINEVPTLRDNLKADEITIEKTEHQWRGTAPDGRSAAVGQGVESTEEGARDYLRRHLNTLAVEANHRDAMNAAKQVPDAPFKTSWHELAMKRMLRYAAENGYDKLSWDKGDVQADRYDLSKKIGRVEYTKSGTSGFTPLDQIEGINKGQGMVRAFDHDGKKVIEKYVRDEKELPDIIGKDAADKLLQQAPRREERAGTAQSVRQISGLDLKVGGEGMKGFYDKILPQFANKYAKKWGAKVEDGTLAGQRDLAPWKVRDATDDGDGEIISEHENRRDAENAAAEEGGGVEVKHEPGGAQAVHSIAITPEMKKSVMEGQPLFQRAPKGWDAVGADDRVRTPEERGNVKGSRITGEILKNPDPKELKIATAVKETLDRLAPRADVVAARSLRANDHPIYGISSRGGLKRVIGWSLESPDAVGTARHEAIHYLKGSGLITPEEWSTLAQAAEDGKWIDKNGITGRYDGLAHEGQIEESVAEEFKDWRKDRRTQTGVVGKVFNRIDVALRRIGASMRKMFGQKATADDIFASIERGETGRRNIETPPKDEGETKFAKGPGGGGGKLPLPSVAKPVGEQLTKWEDDLNRIRMNNEADRIGVRKFLKSMPKELRDPALQERFYLHKEEGTPLSPDEQKLFDQHVKPVMKEAADTYNRIKKAGYPVGDDGYIHRIVKGKGSMYDEPAGGLVNSNPIYGRSLTKNAPSLKNRTLFMAEGDQGTKRLVNDHAPGDEFSENGEKFKVRQATTREIEAGTNLEYHKNGLINSVDNLVRLKRAERNIWFLDNLKKDPTFLENAKPIASEDIPPGWRSTDLPQLAGWKMNPRMANLFDDFQGGRTSDLGEVIGKVNHALVSTIFVNPISALFGHGLNVATHWFVGRGWDNFMPHTWGKSAANGMRALKDVATLSPNYLKMMREGSALQYGPTLSRDFHEQMISAMQGDIKKNPLTWGEIAKAAGSTPGAVYTALSDLSARGLWYVNDALMLQRVYDLQGRGMKAREAIHEAERDIPNYRIPTEAWEGTGGRALSEVMANPNLAIFGKYRYGMLKAYAGPLKDLAKGSSKDRVQAAGKLIAMAALVGVIYPMVDAAIQKVSGNKDASIRRSGPAGPITDVYKAMTTGEKSFADALASIVAPSPVLKSAYELSQNRQSFSGKHVYNPQGSVGEIAKELGYYGLSQISPAEEGMQVLRANKTPGETVASWTGAKLPKPGAVERQRGYRVKEGHQETRAFEKTEQRLKSGL